MGSVLRTVACIIAIASLQVGNPTLAQQPPKQMKLTTSQIEAYLAAQPEVFAIQKKILMGEISGSDPSVVADVERAVKRHGLRDRMEYSDVLKNLILVFNHIDPETKTLKDKSKAKQEIKYAGNVDLVIQYYDRIRTAFVGP
jgi:hypothetical protein